MTGQRNPDLPILDEIRVEIRARIAAEEAGKSGRAEIARPRARRPLAPVARRSRLRTARRVTRRAAVIVGLLCLVAGVALAKLGSHDGGPPRQTEPQELGARGGWTIAGYRDESRLCVLFTAGAAMPVADCGVAPAANGLRATSLRADGRRFVFGLSGAGVRAVDVSVGGYRGGAATARPEDPEAARHAGVPAGVRWFVVGPQLEAGAAPARVVGLDRAGRRLGGGLLDCSLAAAGRACRQALAKQARDRVR